MWACLVAVAGVLLVMAPTLLFPFGRDQAVFAYMAKAITEGAVPYRDAWDLKPPGIYLLYASLVALMGDRSIESWMVASRVVDVLATCSMGVLLLRVAERMGLSRVAGVSAAAWYAALYLEGTYWSLGQAESAANLLVVAAAALCLEGDRRDLPAAGRLIGVPVALPVAFLVGMLAGGVVLLKGTSLLPLAPFVPALFQRDRRLGVPLGLAAGAGLVLPIVVVVGWLAATGGLAAYLDIQTGFVAGYARMHMGDGWARFTGLIWHTGGWLMRTAFPAGLALLGLWIHIPVRRRLGAAVGLGLLAVILQEKYFGYHWQPTLPWMALLAGVGAERCLKVLVPEKGTRLVPAVVVALAWSMFSQPGPYIDLALAGLGRISERRRLQAFGVPSAGDYSFLGDRDAARYIRRTTRRDDGLFIWGFEPLIYLLSGRPCPTRFFFNVPLTSTFARPAWREELLRELDHRPPTLFIVARRDSIPWASGRQGDSRALLATWPELQRRLDEQYERETMIEDFIIYRRRGTQRRRNLE